MIGTEEAAKLYAAGAVDAAGMARLERYVALLREENGRQNLVSSASLEQVWQRHIADSLQLLAHVPGEDSPWLDLGSGAGAPGLIVAIARPGVAMHLVESRRRRADWLDRVAAELSLANCGVLANRLEDVPSFPAAVISARAFAPLDKLLKLSTRFSTPQTVWLLPKGRSAARELIEQAPEVRRVFHVEHSQTDEAAGLLVGRGRPVIA